MDKRLKAAKVTFPPYWHEDESLKHLQEDHEDDLLIFFNVTNKASLTKKLKNCFPNKPPKVSYRQYIQEVLNGPMPETFAELQERKKREREYEQVNT